MSAENNRSLKYMIPAPGRAFLRALRRHAILLGRQARKEWTFLRHVVKHRGVNVLWGRRAALFGEPQAAPLLGLDCPDVQGVAGLGSHIRQSGHLYQEGVFSLYLPPGAFSAVCPRHAAHYPPGSGLKIIKAPGVTPQDKYVDARLLPDASRVAMRAMPSLAEAVAVANTLWDADFGARIHDLVRVEAGGLSYMAYVVEHVGDAPPSADRARRFIEDLDAYDREGPLAIVLPGWKKHKDFAVPGCNGNLLLGGDGERAAYVDFQNFAFCNRKAHLRKLLARVRDTVHFGERHLLAGGRYLYQSVPGSRWMAKRNTDYRAVAISELLARHAVDVAGRVLLDIGCNMGMMIADNLRRGAGWAVGWDRPEVADCARELLRALGMSRVTFVAGEMSPRTLFLPAVPSWCVDRLPGAVVLFLAMRKHIGFPDGLVDLPWKALVYEGHTGENEVAMRRHLTPFCAAAAAEIAETMIYQDHMTERPMALLLRK